MQQKNYLFHSNMWHRRESDAWQLEPNGAVREVHTWMRVRASGVAPGVVQ
jgi:hypothetical protein